MLFLPQADAGRRRLHRPDLAVAGQRAHGGVRRACAARRHRADLQHGLWERGTVEAAIASAGNVPVITRCADNTPAVIAQALDAGAASVLVPLIETVDDARRAGRQPLRPTAAAPAACGRCWAALPPC